MKMSERAEKPRRLMLSPITPPSPAPSVMPGTLRSESLSDAAACESSILRSMTVTDCAMSRSGVSNLAPVVATPLSRTRVAVMLTGGSFDSATRASSAAGGSIGWASAPLPKARARAAARKVVGRGRA
jgi:hypothetical protein